MSVITVAKSTYKAIKSIISPRGSSSSGKTCDKHKDKVNKNEEKKRMKEKKDKDRKEMKELMKIVREASHDGHIKMTDSSSKFEGLKRIWQRG
eukprot:764815-Hanusia_phi.AAC.2